jgi:hypothetical protein
MRGIDGERPAGREPVEFTQVAGGQSKLYGGVKNGTALN